jgi:hypothetical protein
MTHEVLIDYGYKLVDDKWADNGRLTYVHNDDASRSYLLGLTRSLASVGWEADRTKLRSFRHVTEREIIEAEPGGSDTSGHFLHLMKPE